MAFGNKFNSKGGGKKGPRSHKLSHKNQSVKLRPQPEKKLILDATVKNGKRLVGTEGQSLGYEGEEGNNNEDSNLEDEDESQDDDEENEGDEEEECSYRKGLLLNVKPLEGKCISVSGCSGTKQDILHYARELGAQVESSLLSHVTHLITDAIGSEKYEAAVQNGITIMKPNWIDAIRKAWTSADDTVDFDELEQKHIRKPLEGLIVCPTGFSRGEYRDALRQRLHDYGAHVTPNFDKTVDVLLVASVDSPHSQVNNQKYNQLNSHPERFPISRAVWEGWAEEVIKIGGVRKSRFDYWEFRLGSEEPKKSSKEGKVREKRNMLAVSSTLALLPSTSNSTALPMKRKSVVEERDSNGDLVIAVNRKKTTSRIHGLGNDSSAIDSLRSGYVPTNQLKPLPQQQIPSDSDRSFTSTSTLPKRVNKKSTSKESQVLQKSALDSTGFAAIGSKGKSVIKALTTSRSTSFPNLPNPKPKNFSRTSIVGAAGNANENEFTGDDSAFFEGESELSIIDQLNKEKVTVVNQEEESDDEVDLPIFEGKTFSLVALDETFSKIKEAIVLRGGKAWVDERMKDADYIVVPHFGAPAEYLDSDDPRIVTPGWIEHSIFADKLLKSTEGLLMCRPISYSVPLPGAENLLVHPSGYVAPEAKHIRRFVEAIGGSFSETLTKSHTHLIHSPVDSQDEQKQFHAHWQAKLDKAKIWGVEVVGTKWLTEFGERLAAERDGKINNSRNGSKERGKEREIQGGTGARKVSQVDRKGSNTSLSSKTNKVSNQLEDDQLLAGCTIFISKYCDSRRKELVEIVTKLGGDLVTTYSKSVTHMIHVGSRINESFKEFKTAKMDKAFVVHTAWLDDTIASRRRLSEGDYPHTYDMKKGPQLSGLVSSPSLATANQSNSTTTQANSKPISRKSSEKEREKSEVKQVEVMVIDHEDELGEEEEEELVVPARINSKTLDMLAALDTRPISPPSNTNFNSRSKSNGSRSNASARESQRRVEQVQQDDEDMGGLEDFEMVEEDQLIGEAESIQPQPRPLPQPDNPNLSPIVDQVPAEKEIYLENAVEASSSIPLILPTEDEPSSDDLIDTIIPIQNYEPIAGPSRVSEASMIPPASTARTLLKEQTSAMLAAFEKQPTAVGRKSRFGRKKSLIDSNTSNSSDKISPKRPILPIIDLGPETQYSQFEEESMVVRYEDPASKLIMEKIQAALKVTKVVDTNKRDRNSLESEEVEGVAGGESVKELEGVSAKRTRGSSRRS